MTAKYKIGLGVTGGIAAYKAIEIMRLLQKQGCDVSVAMTEHATEFINPLTFRSLGATAVIVNDYAPDNPDPIAHINFSQNIDLLLVAPATANVIAKFANGIADDFLSTTYLASTAPVMIAPAMNTTMWEHPTTQRNITRLRDDGVRFVEPVAGELACKAVGTGKLEDVENIVRQALEFLSVGGGSNRVAGTSNDLAGERFLITVGSTREAIDPVRFISNHSSGKMGFAVAAAARDRGADVTVVAGVTKIDPPEGVSVIRGLSAEEMYAAVMRELPAATVFVGSAAVADYRPANAADAKIKKDGRETMTLDLVKTPDILAAVSAARSGRQIVIGFAAETNNVVAYARSKMEKKSLDLVLANDITQPGAGFETDTNKGTILDRWGGSIELPLMTKREMADKILDEVVRIREKGLVK